MIFQQYYLECLSHASYLIGDETSGRAVVVDPQRDVAEYLADAEALGLTIELVLETHFHADFLSGHLELAAQTGAEIGFSSVAEPEYEIRKLADGERITLGHVVLEIRHTPGHTPGGWCLYFEGEGKQAVFAPDLIEERAFRPWRCDAGVLELQQFGEMGFPRFNDPVHFASAQLLPE